MSACTFIGHRGCPWDMKDKLEEAVEELIVKEGVRLFYVGNQGGFDRLVYQVLCDMEKRYPIKTKVVLAYINQKEKDSYYDPEKTVYPEEIAKALPRFAIHKRNEYMIQKSRYLICYLNVSFSNAYTFVEKAIKKELKTINLGDFSIEAMK